MKPPSKDECNGFDLVVWKDDDGEIVCRAFTLTGHKALKQFVNKYRKGDLVVIYCDPKQFEEELEKDVIVGLLHPKSKKVVPMSKAHLH